MGELREALNLTSGAATSLPDVEGVTVVSDSGRCDEPVYDRCNDQSCKGKSDSVRPDTLRHCAGQ